MSYPTSCTSAYCGRILCDGCEYRPTLAAYHDRIGDRADFEEGQNVIRLEESIIRLEESIKAEKPDLSYAECACLARAKISIARLRKLCASVKEQEAAGKSMYDESAVAIAQELWSSVGDIERLCDSHDQIASANR